MDYLKELNGPQHDAVKTVEGPVMIIAGAGSGKTRVLTYRIAYLIQSGVDPFNILSLTFTNKAAREMKERIGKVIGKSEARNIWMGTFHSVFSKILRVESDKLNYPTNFTIYDTDDAKSLLKTIVNEMGLDDKIYKPNIVYNRISSAKNALINAAKYVKNPDIKTDDQLSGKPKIGLIYEKYAQRCFKSAAMDFDDLLLKTFELFHKYPDVLYKYQQRFKFVMVDEFQDTNFAQYSIIRQLSALHQNICVVGDDAQSIYAFRGANIQNILNFEKDYPDLKTFKLEQNYRSTGTIVEAANSIIKKNQQQLEKNVWTSNEEGNKIRLYKALTDNEEGTFVAQSIFEDKMNLRLSNSDFAILYRTNAQSRSMEEALRRINIPYRIYGGLSFYQRKEIKDLLAYFRVVINPSDEEAMKRIINYPTRGIGKTTLDRLIVAASDNDISLWDAMENMRQLNLGFAAGVMKKIEEFMFMIRSFSGAATSKDAYETASGIASSSELLKELYTDKTPEGVSRYENVQELLNGIKEFADSRAARSRDNSLAKYMEDIALLTDSDNDDDDTNTVSLMTIHASKGLEFKHVHIVGIEENLFPSQMSMSSREELEEERRLFYVAVTRAMNQVTLSFAQTRYKWGNLIRCEPSRFLAEFDPEFLEVKYNFNAGNAPSGEDDVISPSDILNRRISTAQYSIPANSSIRRIGDAVNSRSVAADTIASYKPGMEVIHARFGKGVIVSIDGSTINKMATIEFEKEGEKKLLLKFAKLQVVKS